MDICYILGPVLDIGLLEVGWAGISEEGWEWVEGKPGECHVGEVRMIFHGNWADCVQ